MSTNPKHNVMCLYKSPASTNIHKYLLQLAAHHNAVNMHFLNANNTYIVSTVYFWVKEFFSHSKMHFYFFCKNN